MVNSKVMSRVVGAGAAALAFLVGAARAEAQETLFSGTTAGAFNGGAPVGTTTLAGLTFDQSVFSGTTANSFIAFGGDPGTGPGASNVDNFGSFTLLGMDNTFTGTTFNLLITFSQPTGMEGSQTANVSATLIGTVTSTGDGGVFVDFLNSRQVFIFTNETGTHSFDLVVNDVSVNPGLTASVTGHMTTAPEPVTMALFATGLAGMAAARRRRKTA